LGAYKDFAINLVGIKVTHIFSQETRFVTVITPDLNRDCFGVNGLDNSRFPANPVYFRCFFIL
jgi:hypothetical protein